MTFDASAAGTPAETWAADVRLADRPTLSLDGVDELIVVAAHPDDETLGAGALIAECSRRGIPVRIVVATDGSGSHPDDPTIVATRARELAAAIHVLAPGATITMLGLPDGETREHADELAVLLSPIIAGSSPQGLVAAPWRGDGHRDHRVVGEIVAALVGERRLVEYPIWLWHWGSPADERTPWDRLRSLPVGETKARAIAEFHSQTTGDEPLLRADFLENFARDVELYVAAPTSLTTEYFDATYGRHDDPWGFETRPYELRKRAITVASLPTERYARGLEIGSSIGVLTDLLVERCDDLLAVDVSQAAVDRARERLGDRARVERADVAHGLPDGEFDLIVLSEVAYYFDAAGLELLLSRVREHLAPGGDVLACHWRHPVTDYPLTGDDVHSRLAALGLHSIVLHREQDFVLEVHSADPRSVAERTGLL